MVTDICGFTMSAKVLQALSFLILTVTFERCVLHFLHLQVRKAAQHGGSRNFSYYFH